MAMHERRLLALRPAQREPHREHQHK
jgi:hypothetical protein